VAHGHDRATAALSRRSGDHQIVYMTMDANVIYDHSVCFGVPLDNLLMYTRPMARKTRTDSRGDMLAGTLDMLVLRTLLSGPAHGHTIAHAIENSSDEVLQVEHGSLYPALHRLEDQRLIASFWGTSENNRKAKYYRMTPKGKKHLVDERSRWESLVRAVTRVLGPATE
jgi:transcriptional regulator